MTQPDSPRFVREPLETVDGIPVFSTVDRYVHNYQRIASDHLASMKPGRDNPYIENALWSELDESTRRLVRKYVPSGGRVLDVGVGLGRVLGQLEEMQRYGIDISHEYLLRTRDSGVCVAFSRIEDMPYEDGFFDGVIACDVLEHVIDLHACTLQILRVIKPGGHLLLRVPYREDLAVYLQEGLPYEFIHLRNFDEHSVRLYFQKIHGCRVLETSTVAPHWQGETRLRFRPPPLDAPLRAWMEEASASGLLDAEGEGILRSLASVSLESLLGWMNRVWQESPALFDILRPLLVMDIEMNVVVRKPPLDEVAA